MSAPRDKFDQYSGVRDGAEGVGPVSRVCGPVHPDDAPIGEGEE